MKNIVISGISVLVVALLAPQIVQAQGTIYLSNLGQPSAGSLAVGSDSWQAAIFTTGTNADGYVLNSIQLAMTDAFGTPNGFTVMLCGVGNQPGGPVPGSSLGTFSGSLNPTTGGIFTYTPVSNLTLLPYEYYFIVLTAGTAIANGAYEWSYAGIYSYSPSGGWYAPLGVGAIDNYQSSNGLHWDFIGGSPQFAIDATAVPEPGIFGLFGLGGLFLAWHRRKAKAV